MATVDIDGSLRQALEEIAQAHSPGSERGDVWAVYAHGDLDAAERLVKRWRPWPFDRRAQGILKNLPPFLKAQLLARLPRDLVDAARRVKKEPRRWRDGRHWLKENGVAPELSVRVLTLTMFVKQLRNMARKANEAAILDMLSVLNSRPLKESDGAQFPDDYQLLDSSPSPDTEFLGLPTDSSDDSADVTFDTDVLEATELRVRAVHEISLLKSVASPRQRELLDQILLQYKRGRPKNLAQAGRAIGMNPVTARVHYRNLIIKARKALNITSA